MIRTRFEMTEADYLAAQAMEKNTEDPNLRRRLLALIWRFEGKKDQEIAERLGLHRASVSAMCMRYVHQGLDEFTRCKYTSHYRLLSEEQEIQILESFRKKVEAGQDVTAKAIKAAFDAACGKDTGTVYIYTLLKRHHWQKVLLRRDAEASAKVIWKPV